MFDWQLCIRGCFVHDVVYYITSSLSPAARREHERQLLRFYLSELQAALDARGGQAGTAPSFEHAWLRYRQAAIWELVIGWLICPPVNYGVPITHANVERTATACHDLRTLEALGL